VVLSQNFCSIATTEGVTPYKRSHIRATEISAKCIRRKQDERHGGASHNLICTQLSSKAKSPKKEQYSKRLKIASLCTFTFHSSFTVSATFLHWLTSDSLTHSFLLLILLLYLHQYHRHSCLISVFNRQTADPGKRNVMRYI
jgi:hypothetical protein